MDDRSESQSRSHVSNSGKVGWQVHRSTVILCSVSKYGDFEEDVLWDV